MDQREKVKKIREIVKAAGYDYWATYNDACKRYRKIKCRINGYDYGREQYAKWDAKIKAGLKKAHIDVLSAGFDVCESHRGQYYAYIVKIAN